MSLKLHTWISTCAKANGAVSAKDAQSPKMLSTRKAQKLGSIDT